MTTGTVSNHLVSLVAKQVEDHGLVVWYDPDGHYADVAATLTLPLTTVARYTDSFIALRHEIDPLMNGTDAPRLVIYVPRERTRCHGALVEFEFAGVTMQPGQQPPTRNTRLSVVARNALKAILGDESASGIEKQVEAGKLTLADLNSLATKGKDIAKGVVSLVFGTGNPPDVALAFLASDKHDAEIVKKSAPAELLRLLGDAFGVSFPDAEPLAAARDRLARHVLATDLLTSLSGPAPGTLGSLPHAELPTERDACTTLARTWRLRRDARESYVVAARKVEQDLKLAQVEFGLEQIAGAETFLAVEQALLGRVEAALLTGATADLLARAEAGTSRFWAEANPAVQAHWALVAVAAQVLVEADRVELALKTAPPAAVELVAAYTAGETPWCLLDTYHRRMEKRWFEFETDGDRHQTLERLFRRARQRYMQVGSAVAELFVTRYRAAKLPLAKVTRQTDIFEQRVKPLLGEGKVAYVWVDALRFEMARELCHALAADFDVDLQPGVATVPTITEIGMASLLPHAGQPPRVVSVGNGKLAVEINGTVVKDRKDRVNFLKANAGVKVFDAKLDDLLPKPQKRVRDGITDAALVLVTSQEIDELGEQDSGQARQHMDGVLGDLRRGLKVLADLGVRHVVLAADHGHLFGDELGEDMLIDAPGGDTADLHRRVWVGRGGTADPAVLRVALAALGVESDMDLATPLRFACFRCKGGARSYFHGGLSPQELLIPVATLTAKAVSTAGGGSIAWKLLPGSKKISTRFFSVQVGGTAVGFLDIDPPKVRVEIRAKGKSVSVPVSASYGYEDATGDVQLQPSATDARSVTPNTVTLMIPDEPAQKTVAVVLLDATTGAELAAIKEVEVAFSM